MRLNLLRSGQAWPAKVFIRVVETVARKPIDPVVRASLVRPKFFGEPFLTLVAEVMRGPSFWTPGEREFMAAHVSRLNECPFCARVHSETTRLESEGSLDPNAVASLSRQATAVLPLLEKVTRTPNDVTAADVDDVRSAGVPDEAIVEALHVAFVFNTINRIANALDFAWESDEHAALAAKVIHRLSYKLPRFVLG